MRKLFEKCIKNNKGFSFVELICTVAIFSTVMTVVGGAMVVSANNYSRGSDELALQQEAQTTINIISNLVLDAVNVEYEGGVLTITNNNSQYEIRQVGSELKYWQTDFEPDESGNIVPQVIGENKLLAENVLSFSADTSKFDTTKNVPITLGFESNSRTFTMTYNVTSRNGEKGGSAAGEFAYIMIDTIVLEPGDEYTFSNVSNKPVQWGSVNGGIFVEGDDIASCGRTSNDTRLTTSNESGATLKIGLGEKAEKIVFRVQTQETSTETGEPLAYKDVTVYIRRVNKIDLSGSVTNGVAEKTLGAEYKVDVSFANVENKNLRDIYHAVNGLYAFTEFENVTFSYVYNLEDVSNIVEEISRVQDLNDPAAISETNCNIKIKLKKDLPPGGQITIKAVATRPGMKGYQEVIGTYIIDNNGAGPGPFHIPSGGLRRGADNMQISFDSFESYKQEVGGVGEILKTWRYRPMYTDAYGNITYGDWCAWMNTVDAGTNNLKFNASELNSLVPNLDYQIQIKAEIVNGDTVLWPTYGVTPEETYMTTCTISHAQMLFSNYSPKWDETIPLADGSVSIGSIASPIELYKDTETFFRFDVGGGVGDYFQKNLNVRVYEKEGAEWKDNGNSYESQISQNDQWINGAMEYKGQYKVNFRKAGDFKVEFYWVNESGEFVYPYTNAVTGEGFIYVKVN